ncbi:MULTISPECIES: pyridoxal 5'-phosphate synthase lyase subunit PdxS [Metallosphaera]|uniref:Pyridoxal 5'-phosphate synthase subunit PdxS n=3 Tax=Metallosphaera TaxID=41980 RepID=PDXS_METS5|nr:MULTISPECIES: pyridoxal 5'-phosphate synthase lyase subunit PdxS [Metallosphaera]A4YI11.1 RecName: Full=Pyridoxal 5'-phosphate synthase subunit PdxS; Short=PLP synthase subunit PdxS; AltName: Full=Pdx1 [Metallosphaera sedula DSM 5348]ABP96063.1 pyridoxal phosphate synthase yaaD subunit [Metallosphaera sedula DSM 5348]AIM28047.1 pyridoxal phosphate synthase yaaD subunit [Metallosphaera sedula]AKV74880.1 pyridoxal biosynthesis protein [Metallosphaera sedula]AKV77117.1 pyridoxal biosynthesis p
MRLYELSFDEVERFFYKLAELRDTVKDSGLMSYVPELVSLTGQVQGTTRVKHAFPIFQKGGVVMDVTSVEQAGIAEEAGAVSVMVLDKLPYDVRKAGGVARMADPKIIEEVMNSITIPVMAKVRIGHYYEAKVLEALGVDMIDESEVLTPADEEHHINKWEFKIPFVNGARNLGEGLRRISEGASMIRTKGEPGTGNVSEAVKHIKIVNQELRALLSMAEEDRVKKSRELQVPYELVELTVKYARLPVVNFAAGGIATPADAALMMWLGTDGIFVGSGIFKSEDPLERAKAIVLATAGWEDPEIVLEAQKMISEHKAMMGIDIKTLKPEELMQVRGA